MRTRPIDGRARDAEQDDAQPTAILGAHKKRWR